MLSHVLRGLSLEAFSKNTGETNTPMQRRGLLRPPAKGRVYESVVVGGCPKRRDVYRGC